MDSLFKLTAQATQLIQLASSSDEEDRQLFADTLEGVMGEIEAEEDAEEYSRDPYSYNGVSRSDF